MNPKSVYIQRLFMLSLMSMIISLFLSFGVNPGGLISLVTFALGIVLLVTYWKLGKYGNPKPKWAFWIVIAGVVILLVLYTYMVANIMQSLPVEEILADDFDAIQFAQWFASENKDLILYLTFLISAMNVIPRFLIVSFISDEYKEASIQKYKNLLFIGLIIQLAVSMAVLFINDLAAIEAIVILMINAFYTYYLYLAYREAMNQSVTIFTKDGE